MALKQNAEETNMSGFVRACWLSRTGGDDEADTQSAIEAVKRHVRELPDRVQSAAYSVGQGGALMQKLAPHRKRLDGPRFKRDPEWLILTDLDSLRNAMDFDAAACQLVTKDQAPSGVQMSARAIYREIETVTGPEAGSAAVGMAPAIQFGRFSMPSPEDEWAMTRWYEEGRMADFQTMKGAIRLRRFVSACGGYGRFSVLYEFTSLEDRLEHFENVLEKRAHDDRNPSPAHSTIHEPMSSCVGTILTVQ